MEKFTKANAYKFLNELAELVDFATEEDKATYLKEIKDNFEPQAGGGSSKNPSYQDEETGVMMHYCRFKQEFRPEPEMNMHNGKSKGASKLASKHDYELGKQVAELKAKALEAFTVEQDYVKGAEYNTKADALQATRELAETFSDENIQYIADREAAKAGTNEASEEAVETTTEES